MSDKPLVLIISPASAKANNGNWQTASRWQRFVRERYRVRLLDTWDGQPQADAMIALHARRSAPAIHAWSRRQPDAPLILVLTGTDLYRDIHTSDDARHSLAMASHLVVLQEAGLGQLPCAMRAKTSVIYQSAPALAPSQARAAGKPFTVVMIGHLREEKMPATYMQAAQLLKASEVRLLHIGHALDVGLANLAASTAAACPHYEWLGGLPHPRTRRILADSDLMVIASNMEGGANVIIEAVTSGVPVLASDIDGNRGMLGCDYAGYFPLGDSAALALLIGRVHDDSAYREQLHRQCQQRALLFAPAREQAGVLELLDNALPMPHSMPHSLPHPNPIPRTFPASEQD
ncbi:MAG: selenoneine biosynthesis selenosugar synthase SenB [Lacisediminimonas sp.]|nr:selenoneine biosynthesis selenosugar synthase SenB [Lacisediminimonas sp.]